MANDWTTKEWLCTNGLGGYASSTLSGCNTRRYHGLLVAAFAPPTDRRLLVSKVEETVTDEAGKCYDLFTNQIEKELTSQGYKFLTNFGTEPFPVQRFEAGACVLEKSLFMVQDSNTSVLEYANAGAQVLTLKIKILLNYRDYHSLQRQDDSYTFEVQDNNRKKRIIACAGAEPLFIGFDEKASWTKIGEWRTGFQYVEEQKRGLDATEDCYLVAGVSRRLEVGEKCRLIFSTDESMASRQGKTLRDEAMAFYQKSTPDTGNPFLNDLIRASQQFIVHRDSTDSASLIAGYHWFADWGRDTMIAMRGICIALGEKPESESLIRTFLHYLDRGMIPNRFPDVGQTPEYNTIDATLWVFVVLHDYFEKFGDKGFIGEVFPKLTEIIEAHLAGTRYSIHVTEEGLLYGGEGLVQLTWMDARVDDFVPTPRHGCPVEINALWYNALKIHASFSEKLGIETDFGPQIQLFEENFTRYFYNEKGYLNDVVIPGQPADDSIRPNMVWAVSLPYSVLTREQMRSVVAVAQEYLLTDYGLRTLSPEHPDFQPTYGGSRYERDAAYHQGTVWPFLLGDFIEAYLKVNDFAPVAKTQVKTWLKPLETHFYEENCLHGISEIFDGLHPKEGKGTVQQAWSVAAMIRALILVESNQHWQQKGSNSR